MLPIGTLGRNKYRPYVTFFLIVINLIIFGYQMVLQLQGQAVHLNFLYANALDMCKVGAEPIGMTMRNGLFTMFLHGSITHVGFNMMFLWIFGPHVEMYMGHRAYLAFYLAAGYIASFAQVFIGGVICSPAFVNGETLLIGASGAIAGVMGAFLLLNPNARVRMLMLFNIPFIRALRNVMIPYQVTYVSAGWFLAFWVINDFVMALVDKDGNVAHWAHIGGFVGGAAILFVITMFKGLPPVNPFPELDD
ncbi:rhomboid family intramembrane serine protease [Phototrophicus methaneseepsis]|uniref:Rhomboid family intramembrane serine protease n=1 Tax=Phototrophicus methaneseepsis TaxID=2710758 RepID=A0A7S8EDP3_9CHLR|nr:rhomboid family intramembrane serine protease [Phototrophicus methaneseepsis]QPC85083.1 rhomboid family intramembrane serine protease [Phototrophicus methaneseepsis]